MHFISNFSKIDEILIGGQLRLEFGTIHDISILDTMHNYQKHHISEFDEKRALSVWDRANSCNVWNAEYYWVWEDDECDGYMNGTKEMSYFEEWSTQDSLINYCSMYSASSYVTLPDDGVNLTHQTYEGNIEQGIYWIWKYDVDFNKIHTMYFRRQSLDDQQIEVYLYGSEDTNITVGNNELLRYHNDLNIYNARRIEVKTVFLVNSTKTNYYIELKPHSSSSGNALVGLITILLGVCVIIVISTCAFTIIRALLKARMNRYNRERNFRRQRVVREHNIARVARILDENPSLQYKNMQVTFDQTSWIIWLEDFKSNEKVRKLPEWEHIFHTKCVDEWIHSREPDNITCPLCNIKLLTKSEIILKKEKEELEKASKIRRKRMKKRKVRHDDTSRPMDVNDPRVLMNSMERDILSNEMIRDHYENHHYVINVQENNSGDENIPQREEAKSESNASYLPEINTERRNLAIIQYLNEQESMNRYALNEGDPDRIFIRSPQIINNVSMERLVNLHGEYEDEN